MVYQNPDYQLFMPTVGQDYRELCEMVEVLNRVHTQTQNTMITVTHDRRCAAALCDRAVWIRDGIVHETGGKPLIDTFFCRKKLAQAKIRKTY